VRTRCPSALLRRGSLVGECYPSVGSRLSVWCLPLRRLAILGGVVLYNRVDVFSLVTLCMFCRLSWIHPSCLSQRVVYRS
jgi:hypothetical protein